MVQDITHLVSQIQHEVTSTPTQQLPCSNSSAVSSVVARKIEKVRSIYPTMEEFLKENNPSRQRETCITPSQCFFGDSPSLTILNLTFGPKATQMWLIPQITDMVIFSGVDGTPDTEHFLDLAAVIEEKTRYMKVDELMLFFWWFKTGRYSHFYKTFEPQIVLNSLKIFMQERNTAYHRQEEEERKRREEEERVRNPPITWDEYVRLKNSQL